MRSLIIVGLSSFLCLGFAAEKTLSDRTKDIFEKLGFSANVSGGGLYESQLGMHYVGGSGFVRKEATVFNPIHIDLPRISVGSGGIDWTFGGVSLPSRKEAVDLVKSIMKAGGLYAFQIALDSFSPKLAANAKDIRHWITQLNMEKINADEIGKLLARGAMSKIKIFEDQACKVQASSDGHVTSWIDAATKCRQKEGRENVLASLTDQTIKGATNIAWSVLQKSQTLKDEPQELKEIFLSLTGTVVIKKNDKGEWESTAYIARDNVFDILQKGEGNIKGYSVASNGIDVVEKNLIVPPGISFFGRIKEALVGWKQWVQKEKTIHLNAEGTETLDHYDQKENMHKLFSLTHFPIWSGTLLLSNARGIELSLIAEAVASEITASYIKDILSEMERVAAKLEMYQIDPTQYKEFIEKIRSTKRIVEQRIQLAKNKVAEAINLQKELQESEKFQRARRSI